MSYFEQTTEENSLTIKHLISKLFQVLKPLSVIAGNGNSHLSIDIGKIQGNNPNVATIGAVNTVNTVANQTFNGGVSTFLAEKNASHSAFQNSVRNHIHF